MGACLPASMPNCLPASWQACPPARPMRPTGNGMHSLHSSTGKIYSTNRRGFVFQVTSPFKAAVYVACGLLFVHEHLLFKSCDKYSCRRSSPGQGPRLAISSLISVYIYIYTHVYTYMYIHIYVYIHIIVYTYA